MRKLKKYFVNPDDSELLAMSVVDEPAIESDFIFLSKQKIDKFVALESEEKHMLFGAALRPDFPIYRYDGVEEYYLEFSKEAVEKLSRNFMAKGFNRNFTESHLKDVEGVAITESWIKMDMEKDKSLALGLDADLPVGTWFIGGYCNNAELWDRVKKGEFKGFSVEAICYLDDVEEFEAEEAPLTNEEPQTAEEPTVEVKESVLDKILSFISPSMNPKNEELPEQQAETVIEDPKVEEPKVEEPVVEEPKPNPLEEVVNNLKAEIQSLKEDNAKLVERVKDLGKLPSSNPLNTNPKGNSGGDSYKNWRESMRQLIG